MTERHSTLALVGLAFIVAGMVPAQAAVPESPLVRTVRVPGGGLHPQAAADSTGTIHLIYFKGDPMRGDVLYVRSTDGGETFSKPLRVNSQDESVILVGTVRGPQMAVGKGGRVHVAWMGSDKALPRAKGRQTPMLYSRLNDAGDTFEAQRNLIQHYPGLDGGGSVAADQEGNVYVAWHAPLKEHTEEDRHVWVVRSRDEGKTFGPEVMADPKPVGVCACCGMRIVTGPGKGELYVLYRSARKTVNRDMQLLASADYGETFTVALVHPWKTGQCMMSTSAFARTADSVLAAWETHHQVFFANLEGASSALKEPVPAPGRGSNRKHPVMSANPDGDFIVAWTEGTGWNKGGTVAWQVYQRDGRPREGQAGRADGLPVWGVPAAVALPDGSFRLFY
jgi:hypothetical protein